jgi:pimeloyl-ACP methyl ester carboxylesterase
VITFDLAIGWSLGVQTVLTCFSQNPKLAKKMILLNPTTGSTLHSVLQPVFMFPKFVGDKLANIISKFGRYLQNKVVPLSTWNLVRTAAFSFALRLVLEVFAFSNGFPPEQPAYFHEYIRDIFYSRQHTTSLLELIIALDAPCTSEMLSLSIPTVIMSGFPDFLTGVYHARSLHQTMKNSKHIEFSMASHFLLLEWPEAVAQQIIDLVTIDSSINECHKINHSVKQ